MGAPDPPTTRTCCMLSAGIAYNDDDSDSNLLDPSDLGHHTQSKSGLGGAGGGKTGIIYTNKLGFVDLSHLRDLCDLTKYVYDRLLDGCPGAVSRRAAGTPGTCTFNTTTRVRTTHGYATITAQLAEADLLGVAQSIAYDDSVGYEVKTYDDWSIGGHNSSFSPEDLPSNYLGTWVGAEATKRTWASKRGFDDEVDSVISDLLKRAQAQPKAVTQKVILTYVKGKWVHKSLSTVSDGYLLRRNFTGAYWDPKIDDIGSTLDPASVAVGFGSELAKYQPKYSFTFDSHGERFTRDEYRSTKIPKIREDAKKRYGDKYDSPSDRQPGVRLPDDPPVSPGLASSDAGFGVPEADSFARVGITDGFGRDSVAQAPADEFAFEEEDVVVAEAEPEEDETVVAEAEPEEDEIVAETEPEEDETVAEAEPEDEEIVADAEPEDEEIVAEAEPEDEEIVAEAEPEENETVIS